MLRYVLFTIEAFLLFRMPDSAYNQVSQHDWVTSFTQYDSVKTIMKMSGTLLI